MFDPSNAVACVIATTDDVGVKGGKARQRNGGKAEMARRDGRHPTGGEVAVEARAGERGR